MISRRAFLAVTASGVAGAALDARRAAAQEPKRGGMLRILQIEPAIGFNPALEGTNWPETMRMVYNGLTDFNEKGDLVPGIARGWTASEDADAVTFRLTPGVQFHDLLVVSLGGSGGDKSIINGVGGPVTSANNPGIGTPVNLISYP